VTNTLAVNLPQTVTLQYDLNGNLTNDGLKSFRYDAENQLTNITVAGAWKSDFVFDGFGRRRIAREYTWLPGIGDWQLTNEVRYVYDGMLAVQERDTNNAVLVTYTRGLDLGGGLQRAGGIGGLLARTDTNGSAFYHGDGAGNITALTDSDQYLVARYLYDASGRLIGKWGPMVDANRYRFSSKEVHPNSGLYYYGFRFYEPNLQRWLNQDPIGIRGGLNLYRFVHNSPINAVDLFGLCDPADRAIPPPRGLLPPDPRLALDYYKGDYSSTVLDALESWPPDPGESWDSVMEALDKGLDTTFFTTWFTDHTPPGFQTGMIPFGPRIGCKVKGSYVHEFESGKEYIGKGTGDRPNVSGKQVADKTGDKLVKTKFEPSKPNTDAQAFKDEAQKIRDAGGIPNDNLYNKINSPGEKMLPPEVPPE
jgi:RHS repeat-associated protein